MTPPCKAPCPGGRRRESLPGFGRPLRKPRTLDLAQCVRALLVVDVEGHHAVPHVQDPAGEGFTVHPHLGQQVVEPLEMPCGRERPLAARRFDLQAVGRLERVEAVELEPECLRCLLHVIHGHDSLVEPVDAQQHPPAAATPFTYRQLEDLEAKWPKYSFGCFLQVHASSSPTTTKKAGPQVPTRKRSSGIYRCNDSSRAGPTQPVKVRAEARYDGPHRPSTE